ncbi:MAG TPA: hypothetical protein P5175_05040 [Anaerohalosphaeraceae bacterium]|mgnify:CR=1 FL=1|nr:hypothetical protein [Phycisphaerae bacterium]HOK95459.1 hypothetical protein [Anaerohalosphaeraceae bacterium]HOM75040.1 hypothetical protein [Anaerohalosphaeraceae bacterium]HPC63622.1 hypothetical protein [Anaerohalosphaeraceae bacterium]HPO68877.1 hypothetical protein [Anaerohalosphaeraceae bacterium]
MHSIWAVAQNTLAQALRMKIAVVIILLLGILLPLMSVVMEGDGTLLGKLQTFTSYGLGLISLLLCILTIAVSAFTLSSDLKRKHIFLIVTKPIRRVEYMLGKLLGILLLDTLLLGLFSGVVYGSVLFVYQTAKAPAEQREKAEAEFFTARLGIKAQLDKDQLAKQALARYKELKEAGQIPDGMPYSRVMSELIGQESMKARKVDPGEVKEWEFQNIRIKNTSDPNTLLFVRYKYQVTVTPPDEKVFGMWRVGDIRQFRSGGQFRTPVYRYEEAESIRTVHEFYVPANALAEDGFLGIAFYNNPAMNQTTVIPEELEVLYRTGTFTENYFRAVLMIFIRLMFLAILGLSLSTWLSFPVVILICLIVFLAGLTNGFILDAIESLPAAAGVVYKFTIKPLLWLLPQFDGAYNPNRYIVDGRTMRWMFLAATLGITVCIKGLLMFLAGILIFSRREVAKAVV